MKKFGAHCFLSALLVSVLAPVIVDLSNNDSDSAIQRAQRRAELRSALTAPVLLAPGADENADKTLFHEYQLSPQERADLRRQLREQSRVNGWDLPN